MRILLPHVCIIVEILFDDALPDVKHYYTRHMLCVPSQPRQKYDLLSSLLEKNASEFATQQEWEAEWNQLGLASRLSEEVCVEEGVEGVLSLLCAV